MKSVDQILREAPVSHVYNEKVAFTCIRCPWWAADWNIPNRDKVGRLCCKKCGSFLKVLPLKALIQSTQEENPQHFEAFLNAFCDDKPANFEVRGKEK